MSPSDHDRDQHSRHGRGESSRRGQKGQEMAVKRKAIPIDIGHSGPSLLSPLYSLPALSSLKSYLPTSPRKTPPLALAKDGCRWAVWQSADLDDGRGKRPILVISSKSVALELWTVPSTVLPDDPHVQEEFPLPEQIFSIGKITVDDKGWEAQVLAARIMPRATWNGQGPLVAAVLGIPAANGKRGRFILSLALVSLKSGKTVRTVELGHGKAAALDVSARAIAVTTTHPSPTIHLRHPTTLESLHSPLVDLPPSPRSSLPTFALSGRFLAYTTSEVPERPGPGGLGSLWTAKSASRPQAGGPSNVAPTRQSETSTALLKTAVNVGGAAARGIWAGVKMGVSAAGKAREARLARSAPTGGSLADDEADDTAEQDSMSASRSMEDSNLLDSLSLDSPGGERGGMRVKVVDLCARNGKRCRLIAHFRIPPSRPMLPLEAVPISSSSQSSGQAQVISHLSFSPDGTQLLVSPADGKVLHIVELHPAGVRGVRGECKGEVWHLYELRRGNTTAAVSDVAWDPTGRWIGVSTSHGTTHIFPVHPSASPATAASHASGKPFKPASLPSLSIVVNPITRFRSSEVDHRAEGSARSENDSAVVSFASFSPVPLAPGSFAQDVLICRAEGQIVELARITTKARESETGPERRGSGITQMMRLGSSPADWVAEDAVKARWSLPADEDAGDLLLDLSKADKVTPLRSALSQVEIQTHSINPRILPASIYLSKQVDFFGAKAIDEYNPRSIMDHEARTHRLCFRDEVEAKSLPLAASQFDEPLLSALHSVIESAPESQIPGLPNGRPPKWRSPIPIRHVATGLHGGVGLIQREYAKAQRRRLSAAAVNKLSFEEDTVFASSAEAEAPSEGIASESSPSSDVLPTTEVGDDEEWGEGWEEEYRKAVEDDGAPDDLVLGLLDEEQEERRKWEARQKSLAKQYQRSTKE